MREKTVHFFNVNLASFNYIGKENFLGALLLLKTSYELVLKGQFYEKRQTDVLIIIKRYREVEGSFKKQTL